MADSVIGRGIIELVADGRKLKIGVAEAKRSLRTLGQDQTDISKAQSASIDRYIGKLQLQTATFGKSRRETEIMTLAMRGASNEQLKLADSALRVAETNAKNAASMEQFRRSAARAGRIIATALVGGAIAGAIAFDRLVKAASEFQSIGEKVGDSAENMASLAVAAASSGTGMERVTRSAIRLTQGLTGVDDESKLAGAAVKALGLNLEELRRLAPADRFEKIAKALAGFADGPEKTAVAVALLGRAGAEMLPFLNDLAGSIGRQNILTTEQLRLADEYGKKQAALTAQISLHAQSIAVEMLPAYNDLQAAFFDVAKAIIGVEKEASELNNSKSIQEFAEEAARSLAILGDAVIGVGGLVSGLSRRLGGVAAFYKLVFEGEIKAAIALRNIAKEEEEAAARAGPRKSLSDALDARIAARKAAEQAAANFVGPLPGPRDNRPTVPFSGRVTKPSGGAGADPIEAARTLARDQLSRDLADIKRSSDAQLNAFANAEKIMQAMRSAALVDDKDFFASEIGFIQLNAQQKEAALQQEIDRLQRETFAGKNADKDRLDNARKVAEKQAEIDKIRADAATSITVNEIRADKALANIKQGFIDAKEAAEAYIDTIQRQNARDIAGIGRGTQFRERQAGIGEIEDKLIGERRRLETEKRRGQINQTQFDTYLARAQDTYAKEIELYQQRTDAIEAAQGDWLNGATEALQNYLDESRDIAKQTEDLFANAFQGAEDALVEFSRTGKLNFKSLADSIVDDINRMIIKQNITGPLAKFLQGDGGSGSPLSAIGKFFGFAGGGIVQGPGTATSDSIPARLSRNEFVVQADKVIQPGALRFLEKMNERGLQAALDSEHSNVLAFARGGRVTMPTEPTPVLGSFQSGINFVPQTGVYELHRGEKVTPASENARGGDTITIYQTFAPGTDMAIINRAADEMERRLARRQRGLS